MAERQRFSRAGGPLANLLDRHTPYGPVTRVPAPPVVVPAAVVRLRRELLQEGDAILDAVERLLLADEVDVPGMLAEQVAQYAERLGWRRVARDLVHAHDVVFAVQEEILRLLPIGL